MFLFKTPVAIVSWHKSHFFPWHFIISHGIFTDFGVGPEGKLVSEEVEVFKLSWHSYQTYNCTGWIYICVHHLIQWLVRRRVFLFQFLYSAWRVRCQWQLERLLLSVRRHEIYSLFTNSFLVAPRSNLENISPLCPKNAPVKFYTHKKVPKSRKIVFCASWKLHCIIIDIQVKQYFLFNRCPLFVF